MLKTFKCAVRKLIKVEGNKKGPFPHFVDVACCVEYFLDLRGKAFKILLWAFLKGPNV